jgi:hypothetical protein
MTRKKDDPLPEPEGGRAAERLRQFEKARSQPSEKPTQADETEPPQRQRQKPPKEDSVEEKKRL